MVEVFGSRSFFRGILKHFRPLVLYKSLLPGKTTPKSLKHHGGVQFLSDELSEVSKNRADSAAVSEVSGKKFGNPVNGGTKFRVSPNLTVTPSFSGGIHTRHTCLDSTVESLQWSCRLFNMVSEFGTAVYRIAKFLRSYVWWGHVQIGHVAYL